MTTRKIIFISLSILGISFLSTLNLSAQIHTAAQGQLLQLKADSLLQESMNNKEHMGITAAIYANNTTIWEGAKGWQNVAGQIKATPDMVHRIASITKPMTAVAILQLYEQGKIDLDVPIQTYLPDFPEKKEGKISVRNLLTHTSGINAYKNFKDGFSFVHYVSIPAALKRFKDRKLVGTPGQVYQYTTYGYMVLGAIIEATSGMQYQEYMQLYVWKPAGMEATSVEHLNGEVANKSRFYVNNNGKLEKDQQTNLSMKVAGGGVQSTVGDLLRFATAFMNDKLLKPATKKMMLQDPGIRKYGWPYAMGWYLYPQDGGPAVIGHGGAQAGTSTQLLLIPEQDVAVAVISNTRKADVMRMASKLAKMATDENELNKPLLRPIEMSAEDKDRFVGKYFFNKKNVLEIKREGDQLYSNLNKYKGKKLYPASDNTLFYRDTDAYFVFELNDEGKVVKTEYVQGGQKMYPEKIK